MTQSFRRFGPALLHTRGFEVTTVAYRVECGHIYIIQLPALQVDVVGTDYVVCTTKWKSIGDWWHATHPRLLLNVRRPSLTLLLKRSAVSL